MGLIAASIIIGATILGCSISNGLENIAGRIRELANEIKKLKEGNKT
jgi:outer membrane murein-binding lipoprotein Lpp